MHQCITFILFWNDTLHVSDGLSVHHQEFKTVHTATDICQTDTDVCLLVGTHKQADIRLSKTRRVSFQKYNKFDTLVHLVGFTIERNIRKPLQQLNKQLCKISGTRSCITLNCARGIKRLQNEQL